MSSRVGRDIQGILYSLPVLFSHNVRINCTSHQCGQWLPSVHINYNAAS